PSARPDRGVRLPTHRAVSGVLSISHYAGQASAVEGGCARRRRWEAKGGHGKSQPSVHRMLCGTGPEGSRRASSALPSKSLPRRRLRDPLRLVHFSPFLGASSCTTATPLSRETSGSVNTGSSFLRSVRRYTRSRET